MYILLIKINNWLLTVVRSDAFTMKAIIENIYNIFAIHNL